MNLESVLAMITFRYLRVFAQSSGLSEKWQKTFTIGFFVSIGVLILSVLEKKGSTSDWLALLILLYIVYLLQKETVFKPLRWIMVALAPYMFIAFGIKIIETVAPTVYEEIEEAADVVMLCAVAWMFGVYLMTRNQRKALEQQRQRLREKEEQYMMSEAMKKELEVQVAERTEAISRQKEELQQTLQELKATQAQLIQSEKMASLGELTAGIAHEIQNPLNFVTNFSDVSKELVDEMIQELKENRPETAMEIADDLKVNLDKILHHGKRADGIVKGMLQHSRSSSGQKEPTDINELVDEYLRLAYHGLRAKDKSFNATMKSDFDPAIGTLDLAPQEIGRVVLNLITNAFYAVNEKKQQLAEQQPASKPYEPTVAVRTRKAGNRVEITVTDNGNGVPQKILDKIFQPFFTTKPTGQGTGLGLSLSYDIVKAHGGTLNVQTPPAGQESGAAFTITLPIQTPKA
ncbi:sensor histidine kinase [Flavihumibacter petaseus]|uniref:histidine kinase n=1 Tax=Flavihumibacter petaseus NBRC 106054 TaxID=1220578 RepID=A0A0E9MWG3_9BACT|nr:ATP-binding protein [Flavihumibacter petaseus]GAO41440.1 putative two-component histidine kinase [Flavihumibacter petaseus NBRC 106054]